MNNRLYFILIILIFVGFFSSPFWLNYNKPIYEYPTYFLPQGKNSNTCVESGEWMRIHHMNLLDEWRDEATRNNNSIYVSSDGREWPISLQKTCMGCHKCKTTFCDKCHNTNNVQPYCWTCHIAPEGCI